MTTAVVFDYGFGNVRSMVRALANLGVDTTLTSDYRQSLEADGLVVPGVGAFAACMEGLKKVDGDRVIYDRIRAGRPVLGVCVGEQIMFEHGLEHGAHAAGIGLIGGSVNLLDADVVPHMGWDTIEAAPDEEFIAQLYQAHADAWGAEHADAAARATARMASDALVELIGEVDTVDGLRELNMGNEGIWTARHDEAAGRAYERITAGRG